MLRLDATPFPEARLPPIQRFVKDASDPGWAGAPKIGAAAAPNAAHKAHDGQGRLPSSLAASRVRMLHCLVQFWSDTHLVQAEVQSVAAAVMAVKVLLALASAFLWPDAHGWLRGSGCSR